MWPQFSERPTLICVLNRNERQDFKTEGESALALISHRTRRQPSSYFSPLTCCQREGEVIIGTLQRLIQLQRLSHGLIPQLCSESAEHGKRTTPAASGLGHICQLVHRQKAKVSEPLTFHLGRTGGNGCPHVCTLHGYARASTYDACSLKMNVR